jgi:hypothetical protein
MPVFSFYIIQSISLDITPRSVSSQTETIMVCGDTNHGEGKSRPSVDTTRITNPDIVVLFINGHTMQSRASEWFVKTCLPQARTKDWKIAIPPNSLTLLARAKSSCPYVQLLKRGIPSFTLKSPLPLLW